ncbi:MAG: succinyl-diaminopimelate desuccinylase, partial [Solirubrobacteraceae bacterium]|nr:succinyl-diaminopimelate desuccinylase [Solirubrobacteraceae bacterium]
EGIRAAAGFVKGWMDSNGLNVSAEEYHGLPVLSTYVGQGGPQIILHGHIDVVPGFEEQFTPRVEGERLIGRGAYDMKGGLASIMCALRDLRELKGATVRFVCVPDEESEDFDRHATDELVNKGLRGTFAITGEPTDLNVGVQAKGVLMIRLAVRGRAAHGSTPWLGDNAVLKGIDVFRRIETLPFAAESTEMFDRPSINLGRLNAGDAVNKVPDEAVLAIDIRYLPGQDPGQILEQIRAIPDVEVLKTFIRPPAYVSRSNQYVTALCAATRRAGQESATGIGRDGASDAISFLEAGVPAVEFGPTGGGHHGPEEWVSIPSLALYRQALVDFMLAVPALGEEGPGLRAVEGGLA